MQVIQKFLIWKYQKFKDIMQKGVLILLYKQYKHYIIRSSKFITLTLPLTLTPNHKPNPLTLTLTP